MTDVANPDAPGELAGRRWLFGPAVLDERSMELRVSSQLVQVERKPLEVLLYLLHHAGEVVTKDDLAESLWPGRILTESVLSRCISVLRQALRDDDRSLIRTVHGFGYRLVARVRVEAAAAPPAPALDFEPGDHPPTRPQWRLVERLGTGGHGEAWLARHDKTGDARVFKFALDSGALSSLKREITLYRLLHDSLGARAPIARILEWNLEEPPYFIEMEHVAGGNLQTWSDCRGGVATLPITDRLDIVAQIAEALAAAHSVGALHKDLKPGNVLVNVENGRPLIQLCDFGSGTVLDPQRLEALGITRLGFTKTVAQGPNSATPLYLAPEVIAGQPCTVQADIYALGILLYQMVAGDLRKALAPGWEADVEDELLREDIAAAAAGNPLKRLTDAAQLAERLRTLEQRRDARAAEAAARLRAVRARRVLEELRRTRVFAVVLLALSVVAVAGGVAAYRARNEAVAATATATAVSAFLMDDVFRIDSGVFKPSEASYEALLNRAATEVGVRLKDQPKAAASVHTMLGRRYQELAQFEIAMTHYEQALNLSIQLYGEAAEPTLMTLDRLSWMYMETGRIDEALAMTQRMQILWKSQLPPRSLATLMVRARCARTLLAAGDYEGAENELRGVVQQTPGADPADDLTGRLFRAWVGIDPEPSTLKGVLSAYANLLLAGSVLEETADELSEAESILRESLFTFSKALGDEAELTALTNANLAIVLSAKGDTKQAEAHALRLRSYADKSFPVGHYANALSRLALGRVRLEQRRFTDAAREFQEAVDLCTRESGCPPRMRAEFLWDLGAALNELGRAGSAYEAFALSLDLFGRPNHIVTWRTRIGMADALRQAGKFDEASETLATVFADGPRRHQQAIADLRRVEGLLSMQSGHPERGVPALQDSLRILSRRLGSSHWRTERARSELAAAEDAVGRNP